jgi:hypothetical protein
LAKAISHLARISPSWCDDLRLIDATPLPCGTSRETVKRSEVAESGSYGFCASHTRYYWGLKLYLLAAPDGMPITWCLADPKLGEREICLDLLTIAVQTGLLAPGSTVLADKGLAGRDIEAQIAALGGCGCYARTGATRRPATATSAESDSGSSRSMSRSKIFMPLARRSRVDETWGCVAR